jgi:hypothetical protein
VTYRQIRQSDTTYLHLFREDTIQKKVYGMERYPIIDSTERLFYDFSLSVGQKWTIPRPYASHTATLTGTDSILTNVGYRKRFVFTDDFDQEVIVLVEGIGSLAEPIYLREFLSDWLFDLQCTYEDGQRAYDSGDSCQANPYITGTGVYAARLDRVMVYPNPSSTHVTIATSLPHGQIEFYDASGRILLANSITSARQAVNASLLCQGVYLVIIRDQVGFIAARQLFVRQ